MSIITIIPVFNILFFMDTEITEMKSFDYLPLARS